IVLEEGLDGGAGQNNQRINLGEALVRLRSLIMGSRARRRAAAIETVGCGLLPRFRLGAKRTCREGRKRGVERPAPKWCLHRPPFLPVHVSRPRTIFSNARGLEANAPAEAPESPSQRRRSSPTSAPFRRHTRLSVRFDEHVATNVT